MVLVTVLCPAFELSRIIWVLFGSPPTYFSHVWTGNGHFILVLSFALLAGWEYVWGFVFIVGVIVFVGGFA